MTLRALLTCALLALPSISHAAGIIGPFSNCSGTVGGTAANIAFGAGPPQDTVWIQNNSTAAQDVWINVLPTPTATTASPSFRLVPTASLTFSSANSPIPPVISVIGSASSAAYSCWYH